MTLALGHLLGEWQVDPTRCVVMRHRPAEPRLRAAFSGLVRTRPDLLEAYQSVHGTAESAVARADWIVSCIGEQPGHATLIGLFRRAGHQRWDSATMLATPAYQDLMALGVSGEGWRDSTLQFQLEQRQTGFEFRLILKWPGKELSWYRWADRNVFPVAALLRAGETEPPLPHWREMRLGWAELATLPQSWTAALSQWRGIYFIFDRALAKGYVGSAGGAENILGRWRNYAATGHGGNRGLTGVDPANLVFSILERVSPDCDPAELIALEANWKQRLSTRAPYGLNRN